MSLAVGFDKTEGEEYGQELLDSNLMQELQDRFCAANNIYAVCFSRAQGAVTKNYGSKEELSYIHEKVNMSVYMELLNKLISSDIENVLEEELEVPFIKCCGVAVKVGGKAVAIWIVVGVIKEDGIDNAEIPDCITTTSEARFYKSIEFLETLSKQYFAVKMDELFAEEAYQKSNETKEQIQAQLKRNEAITAIVQMLESENSFSKIVDDILGEVCGYLKLSSANLRRLSKDRRLVDMICEWVGDSGISYMNQAQGIKTEELPFLTGKPYLISYDSMKPESFEKLFMDLQIKAAVSLPIDVGGDAGMYLCFVENKNNRTWDVNDIKFLNDVRQIVQSILTKRIAKNSLASSYTSLEAILENVGCGIYVRDPRSEKILFTNQKFQELFRKSNEVEEFEKLFADQDLDGEPGRFTEVYSEAEERWYDIHHTTIRWVDGRKVTLCTVYDTTSKKLYQQKVERQANNDFLTGLEFLLQS